MSMNQLLHVVLGALMALAGSAVVQLILVPLVETRRRHDERWEQDVLDLGHMLVFDRSASKLRYALKAIYEAVQSSDGAALSREQLAARLTSEQIGDLREASQAYGEYVMRLRWLADRVLFRPSIEPRMQQTRLNILKHVEHTFLLFRIAQHALAVRVDARVQTALPDFAKDVVSLEETLAPGRSYSVDDVNDAYASLSESRARLVSALEDIANTEAPRRIGPIRKFLHGVARARRKWRQDSEGN